MASSNLSPALEVQLHELVRRIRLARLLRGTGFVLLAGVSAFLSAFVADRIFGLGTTGLRVGVTAACVVLASVGLFGLALPLRRRLDARTLAALIEKRHPQLAERLSSAVELSAGYQAAHGAESLVALVCADAAARCQPIDVKAVYGIEPARRWFLFASVIFIMAILPAFVAPTYAHFGVRFARAWFAPVVGYHAIVTPGDAYLAKGRPAIIEANLVVEDDQVEPPAALFIVLRDDAGEKRIRMQPLGPQRFAFAFERLPGDIVYRIAAGEWLSDDYALNAVEPIELVSGTPSLEATPPPYVDQTVMPPLTLTTATDFSVLQFSKYTFHLRFNRAPLDLKIDTRIGESAVDLHPHLRWSDDRLEVAVEFVAEASGTYGGKLTLYAEHGIVTEQALPQWKVWTDEPPHFVELPRIPKSASTSEFDGMLSATALEVVKLKVAGEDLVGLGRLELEYQVNEGGRKIEGIADGKGQLRLATDYAFALRGKVKDGDVLRFRLRLADNRRLPRDSVVAGAPERDLEPQVVFEPALKDGKDQWHTLKISPAADPLQKQEILAQRDEIQKRIDSIKKKINAERSQLERVKLAAHSGPTLTSEQLRNLGLVRRLNGDIAGDLAELGRYAQAESTLAALSDRAFDIAETEMVRSDQHLSKAEDKGTAATRELHMQSADQELVKALARLEESALANDRLAQDRLDQMHMERLAQKQEELTRRTQDLAALDPKQHPKAKEELSLVRAEQDKIAEELGRLSRESKLFQEAMQKFRGGQAKQMSEQAQELARDQRALTEARDETLRRELESKLAEAARKQADLAARADKLAQQAKGKTATGTFIEADQAAFALKKAQVREALVGQEIAEEKLGRFAKDLDRLIALGKNPREAVLRLVKLEEGIVSDLERLGEQFPQLKPEQVKARLLEIHQRQKDLGDALQKVETPAQPSVQQAKTNAADLVRRGAEYLKTRDALEAHQKMKEAVGALRQLASLLPDTLPPGVEPKDTPEEIAAKRNAQRARDLAAEQKSLQEAVRKVIADVLAARGAGKEDARLEKLLKAQADIAAESAALSKEMAKVAGETSQPAKLAQEAAKAAEKASANANLGAFASAEEAGRDAAKKLAALAGETKPAQKKAEALARRQETLNEKWRELSKDFDAQKERQVARQKDIEEKTDQLMQELLQLSQQGGPKEGMHGAKEAAESAQGAKKAMTGAAGAKDPDQAKEMSQDAALKLELAGKQAEQAGQRMQADMKNDPNAGERETTGAALKQGQKEVENAQARLKDGPHQAAQSAMQNAGKAMQAAARAAGEQMAKSGPKSPSRPKGLQPGTTGPAGGQLSRTVAEDLEKHMGKKWGELPGELKTRIVQDLRARYGDDYAPIIQRYFQQIADVPARLK